MMMKFDLDEIDEDNTELIKQNKYKTLQFEENKIDNNNLLIHPESVTS